MAQQLIGVGAAANDGTGDTLRVAGQKTNANFTEIYTKTDKITVAGNVNLDTIAANSTSSKTKTDLIAITQAVDLDAVESATGVGITRTASHNVYDIAIADSAGVVTARTAVLKANLDAQSTGGPTLRLPSGLMMIDADTLMLRAQDCIIGDGPNRSVLRIAKPTSGSHFVLDCQDYQYHLDNGHKFAIQILNTFLASTNTTTPSAEYTVPTTSTRYVFGLSGATDNSVIVERQPAGGGAWATVATLTAGSPYATYSATINDKLRATNAGSGLITCFVAGPTLVPNMIVVENVTIHGGYTDELSTSYTYGLSTVCTGIRLTGAGHKINNNRFFGIQGPAIHIRTVLGTRSGAPTPEDFEKTEISGNKIGNVMEGINCAGSAGSAGADLTVSRNEVIHAAKVAIDYSGMGGVQSFENHTYGSAVGIQYGSDNFAIGDRGEDANIGIRVHGSNNKLTGLSANYPFHKGYEIIGAKSTLSNCNVIFRTPNVSAAYAPAYVPTDTYSQDPLTSGADAGTPMGIRIRTGANETVLDRCTILGSSTAHNQIGLECRAERLTGTILCVNLTTAVIFNTPYLYGCNLTVFAINCTNGLRFECYANAGGGSPVASASRKNNITLYYDTVTNPIVDNTIDGGGFKVFTSGGTGMNGMQGNNVKLIPWSAASVGMGTMTPTPQFRSWADNIEDVVWNFPATSEGFFGIYKDSALDNASVVYRDNGGRLFHLPMTKITGAG